MEQTNSSQPINEPVGFPGASPVAPTPQKKNWKWLVILVLFLVVIGGVTFFVFKSSKTTTTDDSATATPGLTNVATPAATDTPTPAPSVDKTKLNVSVLNGTGTAGEAGLLSDQLKSLGYTNVTTGNAPSQDPSATAQVDFSSSISQDVISEITGKLNDLYTNVTTSSSALPAGVDIQITTGLRKGQTAAPAATNTPAPSATDTPSSSPTATP